MIKQQDKKPLVTILSPCWNGEKYIDRMLQSILSQTYSNIELICIDDGSSDHTKDIIMTYIDLFREKGMCLTYIYQTNQGQAAAINTGLKKIKGKYLSWIDCDDFLTRDSVEKKVSFLEGNPQYSIVTSDFYKVNETDINHIIEQPGKWLGRLNYQSNQFYLTLIGRSIMEAHCHMIRVSDFKAINPSMSISLCREGQNYQLLLPMYYYYKRGFINEPLAYYVIRRDSHYHKQRTNDEWLLRYKRLEDMLREICKQINISEVETERYIRMSIFYKEERKLMDNDGRN